MNNSCMICEKLAPDEVYILYKDDKGVVWVGNKNGKAFTARTNFEEIKT